MKKEIAGIGKIKDKILRMIESLRNLLKSSKRKPKYSLTKQQVESILSLVAAFNVSSYKISNKLPDHYLRLSSDGGKHYVTISGVDFCSWYNQFFIAAFKQLQRIKMIDGRPEDNRQIPTAIVAANEFIKQSKPIVLWTDPL